ERKLVVEHGRRGWREATEVQRTAFDEPHVTTGADDDIRRPRVRRWSPELRDLDACRCVPGTDPEHGQRQHDRNRQDTEHPHTSPPDETPNRVSVAHRTVTRNDRIGAAVIR